jgi:hypothetical protein
MTDAENWLDQWRSLGEGEWRRWLGAGQAGATPHGAALHDAGVAFTRFAEEFARLAGQGPGADPAEVARRGEELEALAQNFMSRAMPAWPSWPGQGAEWAAALQAWSMVLADIARATAIGFAARLAAPEPPTTLRATFDAWVDSAEQAFQAAAHSEAFARVQARLFNELVRARARQQALIEQAARSAGVPTRSEVDALHDELHALKAELAAARSAPPARPPPAPRAPRRKRPSGKPAR